ncbi:hypothetical protein EON65_05040 [archaeon]|nr:MAG: hypothetical protein EON65_05040 [archaeon]
MTDAVWLEYEAQCRRWDRIAEGKGLSSSFRSPPMDAYLKMMGYRTSPVVLWSFCPVSLLMGGCFGLAWPVVMWCFLSVRDVKEIVMTSILTGVLFGLGMAATYAFVRAYYRLPKWDSI